MENRLNWRDFNTYPCCGILVSKGVTRMPQQDMSSKIGKSSSPVIQKVIQNNENVQAPVSVPSITKTQFNKEPIQVPKK
jgi:hypothetical protein